MDLTPVYQFYLSTVSFLGAVPPPVLLLALWGTFAFCAVVALVCSATVSACRTHHKRAFLALVHAYAVLTFATLSLYRSALSALSSTALFWCVGYVWYGILCALTQNPSAPPRPTPSQTIALPPLGFVQTQRQKPPVSVVGVQGEVRLEHAVSIGKKLLSKPMGEGDKKTVEGIFRSLSLLEPDVPLTPAQAERLNSDFNVLLKLMAKYRL